MLIKWYFIKGFFSFCWAENLKFVIFKEQFVIPEIIRNNYQKFVIVGSYEIIHIKIKIWKWSRLLFEE